MKKISILLFAVFAVWVGTHGCTNDVLPKPDLQVLCDTIQVSYENGIKAIIDQSCAYSGCHAPGGIGTGNYTTYNGLLPVLQSGLFEERVITLRNDPAVGMPPNASVYPESIKDDLTEEELLLIQCWLLAGFPEK